MTSRRPNSNVGSGGPGSKGPDHTRRRGRERSTQREPQEAASRSVSAVRRRLQVVGHHVREGAARTKASDGAALPAIVGPPVEHNPAHYGSARSPGAPPRPSSLWAGSVVARRRCWLAVAALVGEGSHRSPSRRQRWRPRSWSGCQAAPTCPRRVQACPAHKYVRPAMAHFKLGHLLHLVLGHAVRAGRWRW